jgi:antitoxin YefM
MTIILVDYNGGHNMDTLSLSEAKMKLSELIEKVRSTDTEVVITKNGRPAAVLVSPDEFEGWRETIAIKSDADLMAEIKKGLSALKKKSKVYTLEELFD